MHHHHLPQLLGWTKIGRLGGTTPPYSQLLKLTLSTGCDSEFDASYFIYVCVLIEKLILDVYKVL